MEKLSVKKQLNIIRGYFSGLSYREIAANTRVSVGAVTNVIADLKAGNYPEAGDVSEQVDMLSELAIEVRKSMATVGEAVTGITIVNSVKELGLEPGDISQYVDLCKTLTPGSVDTQTFVKAAIEYREFLKRTGLSMDEMEKKVRSLEEQASQLEPLAQQVVAESEQLQKLEAEREKLSDKVSKLQEHDRNLTDSIKHKEKREGELSKRVINLEQKAQTADERLATARKELKTLADIGMSIDELSGFTERMKGIAYRHDISSDNLYQRLLGELEQLDKGLGLEIIVQSKASELQNIDNATTEAKESSRRLADENKELQQQQAKLRAQIKAETSAMEIQIRNLNELARKGTEELKQEMHKGLQEWRKEFAELSDKKIRLGMELGRLQAAIEANEWLDGLLTLVKGDDEVSSNQVRVGGLAVLRGISGWLERNYKNDVTSSLLRRSINDTVTELEKWTAAENSADGSRTYSVN